LSGAKLVGMRGALVDALLLGSSLFYSEKNISENSKVKETKVLHLYKPPFQYSLNETLVIRPKWVSIMLDLFQNRVQLMSTNFVGLFGFIRSGPYLLDPDRARSGSQV